IVSMVSEPPTTLCVHRVTEVPGHLTRKGLPGKELPTYSRLKSTQSEVIKDDRCGAW
ncbi:hypothetical protein HAX54_013753, partial [Datura stramonium]|nr:hypothetical protein [Datura stramonium]